MEYNALHLDPGELDLIAEKWRPDIVVAFSHIGMLNRVSHVRGIPANCPMLFWMPWEGVTLPKDANGMWHQLPSEFLVHVSRIGRELWKGVVDSPNVIPHGINGHIFRPAKSPEEVSDLRAKWSEKLGYPITDETIVLLNVDRNDVRKRWDYAYYVAGRVKAHFKGVRRHVALIAHTRPTADVRPHVGGYNLKELESVYGLRGNVIYSDPGTYGYSTEEMGELYRISDVHFSTTTGEGFGIPCLEAAFSGVPTVASHITALPEVLGDDYPGLVPCAGMQYTAGTVWGVPNLNDIAGKIMQLALPAIHRRECVEKGLALRESYESSRMVDAWEQLLSSIVAEDYFGWYTNRWGYSAQWRHLGSLRIAAKVCSALEHAPRVFELGSFNGKFIEFAKVEGLDVLGVEPDLRAFNMASPQAKAYMEHLSLASSLVPADILVMTDIVELVHADSEDRTDTTLIGNLFNRISRGNYKWVIARFDTTHRWDLAKVVPDVSYDAMQQIGYVRRHDMEAMVKSRHDYFTHEIWQIADGPKTVPQALKDLCNGAS